MKIPETLKRLEQHEREWYSAGRTHASIRINNNKKFVVWVAKDYTYNNHDLHDGEWKHPDGSKIKELEKNRKGNHK